MNQYNFFNPLELIENGKNIEMKENDLIKNDNSFITAYQSNIRPIIDISNKIKNVGINHNVILPKIIVLGDKISWRISLIETIFDLKMFKVKESCCPIEIQIKKVVSQPWKAKLSYKTFHGTICKIEINEKLKIEENIRLAQKRIYKPNKSVTHEAIKLKIESPELVTTDLKIVDFPGFTRTFNKEKTNEIYKVYKKIMKNYTNSKDPLMLLCIAEANDKWQQNDPIRILENVCKKTKMDFEITKSYFTCADSKENLVCILIYLKIQIGLEISRRNNLRQIEKLKLWLEKENQYCKTNKKFRFITTEKIPINTISLKCFSYLYSSAKESLPELKDKTNCFIYETQIKLLTLPNENPVNSNEKLSYLIGLIIDLNSEIKNTMKTGKTELYDRNLFYEWRENFKKFQFEIEKIKENEMEIKFHIKSLREQIIESLNKNSDITFLEFFEQIIRNHIVKYKMAAISLLPDIDKNINSLIIRIIHHYLYYFPEIGEKLKQIFQEQLHLSYKALLERILIIFDEENFIFSNDQIFLKKIDFFEKTIEKQISLVKNELSTKSSIQLDFITPISIQISDIANCYLNIVIRRLSDLLPMSVRHCLHIELPDSLKQKFLEHILSTETMLYINERKIEFEQKIDLERKLLILQNIKIELENY